MNGHRAVAGLSLLSALLFCALAAQGASAAAHVSENTTAFTCVKGGGSVDFEDAHCDNSVGAGKGQYGHVEIKTGETTEFEVTNNATANATTEAASVILKSTLSGVLTETNCGTAAGTGWIENSSTGKDHKVSGAMTLNVTKCTVVKPASCKVKEPIVWNVLFKGVDELNGAEKNMGLEFAPSGANFTEITFEGEKCALKGKTFGITGTAISTGGPASNKKEAGATWKFSPEKEMQKLLWGGQPDEFFATLTTKMAGGGNPISLTTTT
jgi:hypothetical protein